MAPDASGKRKVTGVRRVRLANGKYLQLYVLDGVGPRGGKTVGYVRTRKGSPSPAAKADTPPAVAPGSSRPRVVVKKKRHKGAIRKKGR
jgi:hypothetical protein